MACVVGTFCRVGRPPRGAIVLVAATLAGCGPTRQAANVAGNVISKPDAWNCFGLRPPQGSGSLRR